MTLYSTIKIALEKVYTVQWKEKDTECKKQKIKVK